MKQAIFHLQNLTALHTGTGQGVGVVDLPIARAKATNLPIVAGSAIKGVLRDELNIDETGRNTLFGKDKDADFAGAVAFGDANLLILPIRSFAGVVAYATCPFILRQYQRDVGGNETIPTVEKDKAMITKESALLIDKKIALEDLDIVAKHDELVDNWANKIAKNIYPNSDDWQKEFQQRFVILSDSIFSFLADTATEIRTRIRIDRETRVVKDGALWTEENLPADSVLWGVIGVSESRNKHHQKSAEELANLLPKDEIHLQIGGKHTVGRGFCRLLMTLDKKDK